MNCNDCNKEISYEEYWNHYGMCIKCYKFDIEASDYCDCKNKVNE